MADDRKLLGKRFIDTTDPQQAKVMKIEPDCMSDDYEENEGGQTPTCPTDTRTSEPGTSEPRASEPRTSEPGTSEPGASEPKQSFKIQWLLPQEVPARALKNSSDMETLLNPYLSMLSSPYSAVLDEVDLTLPSFYAATVIQYSQVLFNIVSKVITAYPKANTLRFPAGIRIDNLRDLVVNLKEILSDARYNEIHLSFSDVAVAKESASLVSKTIEFLLPCKPKIFMLQNSGNLDIKHLNKFIEEQVPSVAEQPIVMYNGKTVSRKKAVGLLKPLKSKKQKESKTKPKKAAAKMKSLPTPSSNSQMFTYDFHLMRPYIPGSSMFTAYDYWKMEKIHAQGYTGKGVYVAMLDSGITHHPAFKEHFYDYLTSRDVVGHGTMCAGILCGKAFQFDSNPYDDTEKLRGFPSGIAPDADLKVFKVTPCDSSEASPLAVVKALRDIRDKYREVDVVSLSIGSLVIDLEIATAINNLVNRGVIVVCAASNNGHRYSQTICYPARLGNVLCIGSHGPHGKASSFSPVGQEIDFLAPGEDIAGPNSTMMPSYVCTDSGTSFAVPAVAGLVCLIIGFIKQQCHPDDVKRLKNHYVMKEILRKMSTCPGRHTYDEGYGALNPLTFFTRPDEFIKSLYDEVLAPCRDE